MVDPKGVFTAANPAWADVLGWTPKEMMGRDHLQFVHTDDQSNRQAVLERALNKPIQSLENQCVHRDVSPCWISWMASSESGIVYATKRDVTH